MSAEACFALALVFAIVLWRVEAASARRWRRRAIDAVDAELRAVARHQAFLIEMTQLIRNARTGTHLDSTPGAACDANPEGE